MQSETPERSTLPSSAGINLHEGDIIDNRYKILSAIGHGGMGSIYKVERVFFHDYAALKINHHKVGQVGSKRFQREAKAAQLLDHPNLVKIFDFGAVDEFLYFVMEYIEGKSLSEVIKSQGALPVDSALPIFIQVCDAMSYAHERGVIHRDLKPSNIMLLGGDSGKSVKVVDFGIAKLGSDADGQSLTRTGEIFGSPLYMSPEQCLGQAIDQRTDIYSLGCALYETLTMAAPFIGESPLATMLMHQSTEAPSLKQGSMGTDYSPELEAIMRKLLHKNPDQRYQTMAAVRDDFQDLLDGLTPRSFKSAPPPKKVFTPVERTSIATHTTIACLTCAVIILSYLLYTKSTTSPTVTTATTVAPPPTSTADHSLNPLTDGCKRFSSVWTDKTGKRFRTFSFPPKVSLGYFYNVWTNPDRNEVVPSRDKGLGEAKGEVTVPADQPLMLDVGKDALVQVQLLKRFAPGDISIFSCDRKFDAGNEVIASISRLTDIRGLEMDVSDLNDAGLGMIDSSFPHLTLLSVCYSDVTAEGLSKFRHLKQLDCLRAGGADHMAKVVAALVGSKSLTSLAIPAGKLTDKDMDVLSRIKTLKRLSLQTNPGITDSGIAKLVALPHLVSLHIEGCSVTPKAIVSFHRMSNLRELNIAPNAWTAQDFAKLRAALPDCTVNIGRDETKPVDSD